MLAFDLFERGFVLGQHDQRLGQTLVDLVAGLPDLLRVLRPRLAVISVGAHNDYDHPRPETIAALHDGLWMVVNGAGTGGNARIAGKDVSGKTGTAQVISLQGGKGKKDFELRDNGWFVFFAPRDNPHFPSVVDLWPAADWHDLTQAALGVCSLADVGFTVLAIGLALIVLPGPAVLVIPAGLAILSIEFAWARNLLKRVKEKLNRKHRNTSPDNPLEK